MSYAPRIDPLKHSSVLIDANLLLLYVIGTINRNFISTFRRTRELFVPEDFDILEELMNCFTHFMTTANVLTEVSNLTDSISGEYRERYVQIFHALTDAFTEHLPTSGAASRVQEFARLGLTDSGILLLATDNVVVLTDDSKLYDALEARRVAVLNFNHIRTRAWS